MSAPGARWHILTAEYPPRVGGVSDHSERIATALAKAGEAVHVWTGEASTGALSAATPDNVDPPTPGLAVHRIEGLFSVFALRRLDRLLEEEPEPRRLFVQWVPHGYGYRSLNLPFCLWLRRRARRGDRVELMVHEPFLAFSGFGLKRNAAALVHRLMTVILLSAASHVWISAPGWERLWRRYGPAGTPFDWLPLPNGIPVVDDAAEIARVRERVAPGGGHVVGYFGLAPPGVTGFLGEWIRRLTEMGEGCTLLLIGMGSDSCREAIVARHPGLRGIVQATGALDRTAASTHLQACDLVLQPFENGVNARRSSVVAALAHGLPIVTTRGPSTETFWSDSGAVALVPENDPSAAATRIVGLLRDPEARRRLGAAAADLYESTFDIRHATGKLGRG